MRHAMSATIALYLADFLMLASIGADAKSGAVMNIQLILLAVAPCAVCIQSASLLLDRRRQFPLGRSCLDLVVLGVCWWVLFESHGAAAAEIERVRLLAQSKSAVAMRFTPEEAKRRIERWYAGRGDSMPFVQREEQAFDWTTKEIWNRLDVQVFTLEMQGYLVGDDRVVPLGESVGGLGLQSVCVSDLDADGEAELLFTYSWGSGISWSMAAAWSAKWPEPGTITFLASDNYGDVTLDRRTDQHVEVRLGDVYVGTLRLETVDGAPCLQLVLDPKLPKEMRDHLQEFNP